MASSRFDACVRPELHESLHCYLNLSLAGDRFLPQQCVCVCARAPATGFSSLPPQGSGLGDNRDCRPYSPGAVLKLEMLRSLFEYLLLAAGDPFSQHVQRWSGSVLL